jgi:protein-S-isoprenylcysteine O-methyltransferase Ste14
MTENGSFFRIWLPLLVAPPAFYVMFEHGPGPHDWLRWLGLGLTVFGFTCIMLARHTLGRSFSVQAKATELVTSGLYSRIRNPIYVFGMFVFAGVILMLRQPILCLIFVVLIPMQIVRARREARVLEDKFGDEYRRYRERTWF